MHYDGDRSFHVVREEPDAGDGLREDEAVIPCVRRERVRGLLGAEGRTMHEGRRGREVPGVQANEGDALGYVVVFGNGNEAAETVAVEVNELLGLPGGCGLEGRINCGHGGHASVLGHRRSGRGA